MPFPSSINISTIKECSYPTAFPTSSHGIFRSDWLAEAAKLSGKSLHTALALSWLAAKHKVPGVRMTRRTLVKFCISREAYYDSLIRLEERRLIHVYRLPGRASHILLMEINSEKPLAMT